MAETTLEMTEFQYETQAGTKQSAQFKTTVPKSLVQAMGWEQGDKVEWSVESANKLVVQPVD
jgi:bifunctional DNA-binding transcriptional regulator/antitoxin component of YhaV-PrlF toxin-antitoxin module